MTAAPHVGTLGEKPLHASLKRWYAEPGDRIEEPVDGYVIDLVRGDLLIEIQTRGFSSMRQKLARLLDGHDVRIVHPLPTEKWIVKLDASGQDASRRKSPKRGSVLDVFEELVSFAPVLDHPRLSFHLLRTQEEEVRRFEPGRSRRRKGWVVEERRLLEVVDEIRIGSPDDLARFLPAGLDQEWTTADLARELGTSRRVAQQMAYCLRHAGTVQEAGRAGNARIYRTT